MYFSPSDLYIYIACFSKTPDGGSSLSDGLDSDVELAHSYDIVPDMDFG